MHCFAMRGNRQTVVNLQAAALARAFAFASLTVYIIGFVNTTR